MDARTAHAQVGHRVGVHGGVGKRLLAEEELPSCSHLHHRGRLPRTGGQVGHLRGKLRLLQRPSVPGHRCDDHLDLRARSDVPSGVVSVDSRPQDVNETPVKLPHRGFVAGDFAFYDLYFT